MAVIVIDEFKVKPQGIFAKWRYRRVYLNNETGEVTSGCVPGEECMNLPSLDDYNKVSRRYSENQVIRTLCNQSTPSTYQRYTVKAQKTAPFAYVETEENVTACGYQTPLPTPAVPFIPWGTPEYGSYKYFDFCDKTDTYNYVLTIYKKNYIGPLTRIDSGSGEDPIVLIYRCEDDYKFYPIRGLECQINLQANENFDLSELSSDDEREFKYVITRNGEPYFEGFGVPDLTDEPYKAYPYDVRIRATDGLGLLKKYTYPAPVGSNLSVSQRFVDILAYCFAMTGLELDIYTICNLYEQKMLNGPDDDPLAQASVNPLRMTDEQGNLFTCYEVLTEICKLFGAFVCQSEGKWHFVRVNELANQVIRRRKYNYTALFLFSDQLTPLVQVGSDEDVKLINPYAKRSRGPAFKYVEVLLKYGFMPAIVFNGNFEDWDGSNFRYWTKYGSIGISRYQKSLPGSNGQPVLIEDYAAQFDNEANTTGYFSPAPITVSLLDKITMSFNLGAPNAITEFIFRIKVGTYYLKNAGENGQYEWSTALNTCTIKTGLESKNINFYVLKIEFPPIPTAGDMVIQVFGFKLYNGPVRQVNGRTVVDDQLTLKPYQPVQIDNFAISRTRDNNASTIDGALFRSSQNKVYTSSKNEIVIYGDYSDNTLYIARPTRGVNELSPLEKSLHAIITADNSFSKFWYDFGSDSVKLNITAYLAKSILKAHQQAYFFLEGDIYGLGLNFLNIFEICGMEGKQFMQLSAEYGLKSNQINNINLVEIFNKNVQTNDTSIIHTPGHTTSAIPQDINAPGLIDLQENDRIFYPQFGNQFT